MNVFKGLGVCILLAAVTVAMTQVPNADLVLLVVSVTIISISIVTFGASVRRSRRDRRLAGGGRRRA
ncbi:hypothetical protein DR950_12880 [Kitasatospora xanthocidica]|uniref:Uncharacterized protein n=1 Tax=Kitasatospora xanthocidica TaxID=83382 RepID=A0A372ZT27_9ACTN|nr:MULTISPECIES: hypothetical protein [Streptomycetaceae]OKI07681.1 hypothetical protein AMK13_14130 [Streptomyces sp. CB02056]RGD58560.1 hypothetical protein DR950_12880 [Kitasatospora xanthocidica]